MILTTKGRYAINAINEMVENSNGQPMSLATISQNQNISVSYLEQIFSDLKKAGIVTSVKGPGGGYIIRKQNITAFDVIKAVGEKIRMTSCANENNCVKIESNNHKCKTHNIWKGLEKVIESYFSSINVSNAEICDQNNSDKHLKQAIYFDNNATTKIAPQALTLMNQIYQNPLNSSSVHQFGQFAQKTVNQAKIKVANLLNAHNYQIIFTSGATESNNLAIKNYPNYKIITCAIEHPAVLQTAMKQDHVVIGVDKEGILDLKELEKTIKDLQSPNFLVSVMLSNNESGVIQPLKEIAKIAHQHGGLVHSDLTQGPGKFAVDLEDLNIDFASLSSHKLQGPQGVGALLVRNSIQIEQIIHGGTQQNGKRPGTVNTAGVAGFGEACKVCQDNLEKYKDVEKLRDYLEENLKKIAKNDLVIFSQNAPRLPNTSFFSTPDLDNKTLMINLDLNNIAVSVGSACSSGVTKLSHVLKAMHVDEKFAKGAIRISLGSDNNKAQVDKFIDIWKNIYQGNHIQQIANKA